MLTGRFGGTTGRPYIEGRLFLPRLGIDGNISFLLDTGADSSILMPGDALRLKVPYDQLTGDSPAVGLGGEVHCYEENAVIAFSDPGRTVYAYQLDLDILPVDPTTMDFRSLLGRDILDRWRIVYDPSHHLLQATVRTADYKVDISV